MAKEEMSDCEKRVAALWLARNRMDTYSRTCDSHPSSAEEERVASIYLRQINNLSEAAEE